MYEIEKGIEIPKLEKYPYKQMEVGDSFFVPVKENQTIDSLQSGLKACTRTYVLVNKLDFEFATRRVEGGVRVWRTK